MKKQLITGSGGFLGSGLKQVLGRSQDVALSVFNRQAPFHFSDVEGVFHIGSLVDYQLKNSQLLYEGNVLQTQMLVGQYPEARFVFSSSVSVYGSITDKVISEDTNPSCQTPYALSKLWAEQFVASLSSYGIVRFASLYGPGMKETTLIPNYVNQALAKGVIEVWGNGMRRQNYLHQTDAIALLLALMNASQNGIFLGADTLEYSNVEIAEIITGLTGAQIRFVNEDHSPSTAYNNEKTRNNLNWKPETQLEAGISQYIEWKKRQF